MGWLVGGLADGWTGFGDSTSAVFQGIQFTVYSSTLSIENRILDLGLGQIIFSNWRMFHCLQKHMNSCSVTEDYEKRFFNRFA